MKFLMTLHMPSARGDSIHQITVGVIDIESCEELCDLLNEQEFICATQWYKREYPNGETAWQNRGDLIINTAHIGKIQEFYENKGDKNDKSHRHNDSSRSYAEVTGGTVRTNRKFV